jgi:transcriptional regulator
MYLPAHFVEHDPAVLVGLMRRHAFATLVTIDDDGQPFASHLPFLVETDPLRLSAHVARANPQWRHLDRDALAIFHGPHAYVSPTWYRALPEETRVPTWNYAVVHARGRARLLDEDGTAALVARLSAEHDPAWTADLEAPARRAMLRAIVGFAFDAPRLEGKLKLSQNRAPADRERVRAALAVAGHDDLAALMR